MLSSDPERWETAKKSFSRWWWGWWCVKGKENSCYAHKSARAGAVTSVSILHFTFILIVWCNLETSDPHNYVLWRWPNSKEMMSTCKWITALRKKVEPKLANHSSGRHQLISKKKTPRWTQTWPCGEKWKKLSSTRNLYLKSWVGKVGNIESSIYIIQYISSVYCLLSTVYQY